VFCAVITLVTAYVVGVPAYALFFSEGRPGTAFFVLAGAATFAGAAAARWRIRPRSVEPFPQSARAQRFRELYVSTAAEVGYENPLPPLLWSYTDQRTHAQTVRWQGTPAVVVSAGLVQHARAAPEDVRAYLTHELAHVANGDLAVFEWTIALTGAFRLVTILAVIAAATLLLLPSDAPSILFFRSPESPLFVLLLLMVGTLWLFSVVLAWLLVVRYAGVLTSLRELHADIRAAAWMPLGTYVATIRAARDPQRRSRLRSLITPRLIHMSARERVELLSDSARLVAPKIRYFALVGGLVLLLQSSPFTVGMDSTVMRVAPLTLWAVLAVAYLLNLQRVAAARSSLPELQSPARLLLLAATTGLLLALPTLRSPQLYPSLLTIFTDQAGTIAVLRDEWSQWRPTWAVAAAVFAGSGIAATIVLCRLLPVTVRVAGTRRFVVAASFAAALEALTVGLALYTSTAVTRIDPLAAFVHNHRAILAALPATAFVLLVLWKPAPSRLSVHT
jgi:Zn-dependent protease with chaperone function